GDRACPSEILSIAESLRGDSPPSREARERPACDVAGGAGKRSHWDGDEYPHPTLNQSFNTGGVGGSNQELFSQRGAYLAPAEGCAWDGVQISQTFEVVLSRGQTMPKKNRFPAVLIPDVLSTLDTVCGCNKLAHPSLLNGQVLPVSP